MAFSSKAIEEYMPADWTIDSWRSKPVSQQAEYDDEAELERTLKQLTTLPPIVTSWEVEKLKNHLAAVSRGECFLLQGGDCSEKFADCRSSSIDSKLKILLKMSLVLIHGGGKQVVRVGRIAGQYAKPRSSNTETIDGVSLPSYRGDLINRPQFTPEDRRPDPKNLLEAYSRSAMTINFIRSLLSGGFGDVHNPQVWDLSFADQATRSEQYAQIVREMSGAVRFLETMVGRRLEELGATEFYTSHEGLHLPYEQAVSELPPLRDGWYNLGTHFPWIGDRTRALGGAHIEYFRGLKNPIGVKVGPTMTPGELVDLANILNPDNEPGRLMFIHRMGEKRIADKLPVLLEAIKKSGHSVVWCSDPMHGNTYKTDSGIKTRHFDAILSELEQAFAIHDEIGTILGGVHFELTGEDVTEVVGGARGLSEDDLHRAYESDVDPRLNHEQALELAFLIAAQLRKRR
jgi:3-deoxy-7-phosphoheptulonate synthase